MSAGEGEELRACVWLLGTETGGQLPQEPSGPLLGLYPKELSLGAQKTFIYHVPCGDTRTAWSIAGFLEG